MDNEIITNHELSIKDALSELVQMAASGRAKNLTAEIENCLEEIEYLKKWGYSLQHIADWLKSKGISKESGEAITAKNIKDTLSKIRAKTKKKALSQSKESRKPAIQSSASAPHVTSAAPAAVQSTSKPAPAASTAAPRLAPREKSENEEDENTGGQVSSRQRKGEEIAERYASAPTNPLLKSFLKTQSQERTRD